MIKLGEKLGGVTPAPWLLPVTDAITQKKTVSNGKCPQSVIHVYTLLHVLRKFSKLHNQDRGPKGRERVVGFLGGAASPFLTS